MLVTRCFNLLSCFACYAIFLQTILGEIVRLSCRRTAFFELDRENERLKSNIILRKHVKSTNACNLACVAHDECQSINFKISYMHDGEINCELIGTIDGVTQWEEGLGWNHYSSIPKVGSRCYGVQCPSNQFCKETCEDEKGYRCLDRNPCLSSPCKNNATCHVLNNEFSCQCPQGYEGDLCELAQTCKSGCTATSCGGHGNGTTFTASGTGRNGDIKSYTVPTTGVYFIKAAGAKGGTHTTSYGSYPGLFCGGNGAVMQGEFNIAAGTELKIVVGQRGGDSVEVKGGQATSQTAASLGLSIEDNAGTGGGGGTFVYTSTNLLLIAAGGGGGASAGWNGVDASSSENGTDSIGADETKKGEGGKNGQPGQCCNSGNYHGGAGAGWLDQGGARQGASHGERGGSRLQSWIGGMAGNMNSGNNGGPAPGAVGGFGGGGGGSEDNGASGAGGGYSGGGSGSYQSQAGGGGGSYCNKDQAVVNSCFGASGGNKNHYGYVIIKHIS